MCKHVYYKIDFPVLGRHLTDQANLNYVFCDFLSAAVYFR